MSDQENESQNFAKELISVSLESEMRQSYLDYAMSVIVGRALPDVRDGLKPVHRRVLFAMSELNNDWNKPYKKSARIVGDVVGKYHPHGDTAVYDTIVRMAQGFSLRYPLVDGQGNFGSVDGDNPAAMRYTEIRMAKIAHELLTDIDKETVDFVSNYDGSFQEPKVLPSRFPNLLVNGSAGIAVGMATNIPPHNLSEVLNACLALINNPALSDAELLDMVPGPDFPTAGLILGRKGMSEGYLTGRGRVVMRARTHVETEKKGGREAIIVDELPYQVNKARLVERIAELVKEKKIEGISDLRDESDKSGMRVYIELKREALSEVVLNNLFQQTQMQSVFGINMVALVDGRPQLLSLRSMLEAFLRHREEVVVRRTIYLLRKARERAHILEGLAVSLANIDPIIALIRQSSSRAEAKESLLARQWEPGVVVAMLERAGEEARMPGVDFGLTPAGYQLSEIQAQAILDMRLHQLTALEQEKIVNEYQEVLDTIAELSLILSNRSRLLEIIRDELSIVLDEFGDARRTEIVEDSGEILVEDLIPNEEMVVTITHAGYIKAQPTASYRAQKRGGRGKTATSMKEEDFVEQLFCASAHDHLLFFSNFGKVYWQRVFQLPSASRTSRGRPIVNLLNLARGERISTVLPVSEFVEERFVLMATEAGVIKKTDLTGFSRPRPQGIIAIKLDDGDRLIGATLTAGDSDILLCSWEGKAIRFSESEVRAMGRASRGVRGIALGDKDRVISVQQVLPGHDILVATEQGYGKRTAESEFRSQSRGGQGIISIQTSKRNGKVVGALVVTESDEIMLITNGGILIRTSVSEVSKLSRNTQGVRLIQMQEEENLVGMVRILEESGEEMEGDAGE